MRRPIIKTDEQLNKMNKAQFNKHRYAVNIASLNPDNKEMKEYSDALTRYALNRWYDDYKNQGGMIGNG